MKKVGVKVSRGDIERVGIEGKKSVCAEK